MRSGWLVAVSVLVFAVQAVLVLTNSNPLILGIAGDGLSVVLALAAAIGCFMAWSKLQRTFYTERKGWLFSFVAFLLFAVADGVWAYFEFVNPRVAVFLVPQLLWTAGYLLWIAGLGHFLGARFFPSKVPVVAVLGIAGLLAVFHAYAPLIEFIHTGNLLSFLNALYVSYDYVLLGIVLLLIGPFVLHHTRLSTWMLVGFAIIARILFDFILVNSQGYWAGHPAVLLYSGTYLLCLLGAHAKSKSLIPAVRKWLSR